MSPRWKSLKKTTKVLLNLIRRAGRPCLSHEHYQPANSIISTSAHTVNSLPDCLCEVSGLPNEQVINTGHLDVGGVEHDADGSTEGLGGEVVAELSTDNAGVAVWPGNLAPNDPDVGTPNLTLRPVNESNLLAEVEVCGLSAVNTVDLDQTGVGVDRALGALVAQVATLDIESVTVFRRHYDGLSEQQRATQTSRRKAKMTRKKSPWVV